MNYAEIAKKRVLGVPIVYWGLAIAGGLAFIAWKMKPSSTASDTTSNTDTGVTPTDDMSGLNTNGTVVVQPVTPTTETAKEETNQTWLKAAVDYVVNTKKLATVGDAQSALTKYLNGDDLSYFEGQLRDAAVTKLGLPPEGVAKVGVTGSAPAQKQFSVFPGVHKVKSNNDDTPFKLAGLYYGKDDLPHAVKILEYNTSMGTSQNTFYKVGDSINIPEYKVVAWYQVTGKNRDQYISTIASQHGLTAAQVLALNPGISEPINIGYKVRYQ